MTLDRSRLERLLGGDSLAALRRRLAERCVDGGGATALRTLSSLTAAEHACLAGLLGRSSKASGDSLRLSLAELDQALLRAGLAPSLRSALELLDGPLRDHKAERSAQTRVWSALLDGIAEPSLCASLQAAAAFGRLKRAAGGDPVRAAELLAQAQAVIAALPVPGMPLAWLAARTVGDAHALDAGRSLANLVLNARAPADDANDAESARVRWAQLGVAVNELARPVLCLNLSAAVDTPVGALVDTARQHGEPLHLSLQALLRAPPRWLLAGCCVHVCENPSIVALAATRLGHDCPPLVCTEGMPAAAQQTLLRQLRAAGADLAYHGDFDWPGIAIGNLMMSRFEARPWCFGADDYSKAGIGGMRLEGNMAEAAWDPSLSPTMLSLGIAIHEEALAEALLAML
jgi:uncharacterized protein (TIGR02679 family)